MRWINAWGAANGMEDVASAVFNVGVHYSSSENYSTILNNPTGVLVGYHLNFPGDEPFLGVTAVRLDFPNRDSTFQREKLMHWMLDQLGLPFLNRRYIHCFLNGVRRGSIYVDTERPNDDFLEEWFSGDDRGDLMKTDPWYEATTNGAIITAGGFIPPRLTNYLSGGVRKVAYYRFAWKPRAVKGSANDYTNLFALIDAYLWEQRVAMRHLYDELGLDYQATIDAAIADDRAEK
mgnify:CR=1 FL=1